MDELHPKLILALTNNDSATVQSLVVEQCRLAAQLQRCEISDVQRVRLQGIRERVTEEQALVAQALKLSEYFLTQLHKESRVVEFG